MSMQSWKFFMYSSALDKISIHLISSMLWNLVGGAKEAGCTQMEGGANLTLTQLSKIFFKGHCTFLHLHFYKELLNTKWSCWHRHSIRIIPLEIKTTCGLESVDWDGDLTYKPSMKAFAIFMHLHFHETFIHAKNKKK